MKISVIICNYNYGRFLPFALESVLAQSYHDYEIIAVDDGSTDDSASVLRQFEASSGGKIKPIFQTNQGQAAAFNTGYTASDGEIIAFLDSDDVWLPNKLQRLADTFQSPNVAGVMHQFNQINATGEVIDSKPIPQFMPSGDLAAFVVATGGAWCFASTSGLSYRRTILENVFPIAPDKWRLCADGALAYCTAFLGHIETLNEVLASYRIHGGNSHFSSDRSQEKSAKARTGIEMTNSYLNDFLQCIGSSHHVTLAQNLQYRRDQFYSRGRWDIAEVAAIIRLILCWPLYSSRMKTIYVTRFIAKSVIILAKPAGLEKAPTS
jgi:hypothetical protein